MKRDAIILAVIFAALAAVVLAHVRGNAPLDNDGIPGDQNEFATLPTPTNAGPEYLTYNLPWFFMPPVANFLPSVVQVGTSGGTVNAATSAGNSGACKDCEG